MPNTTFKIFPTLLYFSLLAIRVTISKEVQARIITIQCPMEYAIINSTPIKILDVCDINTVIASSTGVLQGESKKPPNIPSKNAPARFFFKRGLLHAIFCSNTPNSCIATNTKIMAKMKYHQLPNILNDFPIAADMTPITVKVMIIPIQKVMLYNSFFLKVSFSSFGPAYIPNN